MRDKRLLCLLAAFALAVGGCGKGDDPTPDAGDDTGDTGECTPGEIDCECLDGNVCNTDSEMLVCVSGVCARPIEPDPGQLNSECANNADCGTHNGQDLTCIDLTCQLADCLSGATNCPCGPMSTCSDAAAACDAGTCRLTDCTPGAAGCACDAGVCDGDLACVGGFCSTGVVGGLELSDGTARACEVLVSDPDGVVQNIAFNASLHGQYLREGDVIAGSFYADQDAPIDPGAASLVTGADQMLDLANVTVTRSRCFAADGSEITGAIVDILR